MKYITLLLSIISLTNTIEAEEGVTVEDKLKITDTSPTGNCKLIVQEGDLVTWMSYGYLLDGKIFDVGEYEIKIGNDEAPKGIDQGLRGLCYGDERSLRIHPDLAYGEKGLKKKDTRVPGNTIVIYDVKIMIIERTTQERKGLLINKFLKYRDTNKVENCGMKVEGGDKISWHYIGTLTDGEGFGTGDFIAKIDKGEVITGVNEAMKGLCVGGKRIMVMHHSYAYGPRGIGKIPPYSNLVFKVHLKSIERPGVGWEELEIKQREASVSKENPIKITDLQKTGNCDINVGYQGLQGDHVTWKRVGYLLNGKIFDDIEVETTIGDGTIIPALENGLLGLCVGDSRSLTIHPASAYGSKGIPGKVPINATVIYDVTVVDITKIKEGAASYEGIEEHTGLKPNQKLRIEILMTVENCTMKTETGDTISWHYRGTLLNGTEFYKGAFKATLGRNEVIAGVDRGMRSMCVGEKRKLTVHSDWGYGDEGKLPSIPPKSTLIFENVLTNIQRPVKEEL